MKRKSKTFPAIKFILSIIALILMSGAGVMAVTTKISSVDIKLSDGYIMTVLTNKTNVAEILKDNNILIQENEKVTPSESENITDNKTIIISNKSEREVQIAKVSESGIENTLDNLLKAYDSVVEKIEVKREEIPFETIKKDISDGAKSIKSKVLQEGKNGIKETTYKIKYQNNTEIDRTKISEKVITEPVDKIVQIRNNSTSEAETTTVSSRSSTTSRTETTSTSSSSSKTESKNSNSTKSSNNSKSDSGVKIYKVTAYCSCSKCCGKWANGITAMGTTAKAGRTVAAPKNFKFGTKLSINGKTYVVEDRGGAIKGNRIDMYVSSHAAALKWGVKYLPVKVIE